MCWSAEVSLQSFYIGCLAIVMGFIGGVPLPVLFFCLTITCMQLIEAVVWTYYDDKEINKKASMAAVGLLMLQPVAAILTLQQQALRTNFLAIYGALVLVGSLFFWDKDYSMTRAENGHLAWNWLKRDLSTTMSLVGYFLFLFVPLLISKQYELITLALVTLGASLYSFWTENTWGSMWCWIINGIVPLVIAKSVLSTA